MTEYRFRHSRGYNYYTVMNDNVAPTSRKAIIETALWMAIANGATRRQGIYTASFVLATIEANATEETTMFDNVFELDNAGIFARREPKPVLWRCLNPRCKGYQWKSSPRHTMGCPKCRKDGIERVEVKKQSKVNDEKRSPERTQVSDMQLSLLEPTTCEGVC